MTNEIPDGGIGERDMDLVRSLLIFFARKKGRAHIRHQDIKIDDWDTRAHSVGYYYLLLYQAGFLNAEPILSKGGRVIDVVPFDLTWQGHEFLAPIRDDAVWRKTKAAAQKLGTLSVETICCVTKSVLAKKLEKLTDGALTL